MASLLSPIKDVHSERRLFLARVILASVVSLLLLGIGPGDRVATSTLTFAATANAIRYVGAEPVFIDADHTWTMDPNLLEAELVASEESGTPSGPKAK